MAPGANGKAAARENRRARGPGRGRGRRQTWGRMFRQWIGRGVLMAAAVMAALGLASLAARSQAQAETRAQAEVQAEIPDIHGRWSVAIELSSGCCRWEGSVTLRQRGREITGKGAVRPVGRRRRCPSLGGAIKGRITGPRIGFGFATGALGRARFDGIYDPQTDTMEGAWRARNATGPWRADRVK